MFHAVPLHPKLQISTRNGLVSVCWNVQQEMWCQHNFNLESVLSWLVPARGDVYIVYIPLFGYMHSAPVSTFTWQVIFVYIHLNIQGFVKFLVLSTVPQNGSLYEKHVHPDYSHNNAVEWHFCRENPGVPLRYESLDLLGNFADNHDERLKCINMNCGPHLDVWWTSSWCLMATTSTLQCFWCPWKDLWCFVCLLCPSYRVDVFVLNEHERVLSSWTKWQDCIEKQQHSRYWRNLFLCWGLIWSHSRIFILFLMVSPTFHDIIYRFQISLAFFTKAICRKTKCKPFASFGTQERACELLLQGGGGFLRFSPKISPKVGQGSATFFFLLVGSTPGGLGFESGYTQESQSLSFSGILSESKPPGPKPTINH